jgi:hypothetical protein
MTEFTKEFKTKIYNSVQDILTNVHVRGGRTTIKDMRGRLTFACPYCGDSFEDEHKKRGNLFFDTLKYHCFNDGCKKHTTLSTLLKDFGVSDNLSSSERLDIIEYIKSNSIEYGNKTSNLEYHLFEKLYELAVPIDMFYIHTKSKPITKDSEGYNILKERLLTNRLDEFSIGYNRLLILNLTPDKKKVIGYQIRILNKNTKNKYLSFSIEKLRSQCNLPTPYEELGLTDIDAERLNKLSTLFNIMGVDFTRDITLFEGPIDSKFMKNSLGLASVNRELSMFDDIPNIRHFFDNDKAGKLAMIELLREGKTVFMWNKFIEDFNLNAYKPKNLDIIKDLNNVIQICYNNKLNAFKYINNYFTNSSFDLINI